MRLALADREILKRILNVRQILNLQDALRKLRSEVERAGSQRAFARKAGKHCGAKYCRPKKFFARSIFRQFICRNDSFAPDHGGGKRRVGH